jgi:hypothetical protein
VPAGGSPSSLLFPGRQQTTGPPGPDPREGRKDTSTSAPARRRYGRVARARRGTPIGHVVVGEAFSSLAGTVCAASSPGNSKGVRCGCSQQPCPGPMEAWAPVLSSSSCLILILLLPGARWTTTIRPFSSISLSLSLSGSSGAASARSC